MEMLVRLYIPVFLSISASLNAAEMLRLQAVETKISTISGTELKLTIKSQINHTSWAIVVKTIY